MSALPPEADMLIAASMSAKCHKRTSTSARPNLTNSPKIVIAKTQIQLVVRNPLGEKRSAKAH